MSEYKPAKNGIFSPEEFPPSPKRLYECAYSGRIDAWGQNAESYLLGYVDAVYTSMLADDVDKKKADYWSAQAACAIAKGCWEKNLERSQIECMFGDDEE